MCFRSNWKRNLPQLEFAYDNSNHLGIDFGKVMLMSEYELKSRIVVGLEKVEICDTHLE